MGSENISCRCLLLAALALHCAASVASEGSTEVSAGVAADAEHQQHDAAAGREEVDADWQLPSNALPTLDKRAYYVSEYKRLPVYNFGLGKRSEPNNRYYAFGLGKRERGGGRQQYSFGLGKRPNNLYSFGLGKRSMEYTAPENAFEDEDVGGEEFEASYDNDSDDDLMSNEKRAYDFGQAKRYSKSAYNFGLGKRAPKYSFGLGKRAPKYSFGLGKRLPTGGRQYSFGLGKREISKDELRAFQQELQAKNSGAARRALASTN